jgi:hypothetical protein
VKKRRGGKISANERRRRTNQSHGANCLRCMLAAADIERGHTLGRCYGYPECCIEAFVADLHDGRDPFQRPTHPDGYVMCAECAEREQAA